MVTWGTSPDAAAPIFARLEALVQDGLWSPNGRAALVGPKLVMALGGTSARAVLGHPVTVSQMRGAPTRLSPTTHLWVTIHPSFLLRIPDDVKRREEYARFVKELKEAQEWIAKS